MISQFTAKMSQAHERDQPMSADFYAGFGIQGLGLGVWGLGFRVWSSRFRLKGLGFGVWGLRVRVQG